MFLPLLRICALSKMLAVNEFLMSIPAGTRAAVWQTFIVLLVIIACVLTGVYCFRFFKSYRSAAVCGVLALVSFAVVIAFGLLTEKMTQNFVLLSGVTYFFPYLLCASFVLSKYLHRGFLEIVDLVALAYLPARAVNIIGCTVSGCCQGVPAAWGLYSAVLKTNVIPVQLYESAAIFVIWAALNLLYHRSRFPRRGTCAAYILILFGGLNVVTDIFTYIQPKIVHMVSVEGIFAFITMCAGLILLYIIDKKQQDIPAADPRPVS